MKKLLKLISMILVFAVLCTSIPVTEISAAKKSEPVQILFIGNSKTALYGSPAKSFEALAKYNGKNVEVTICAEGGKSLSYLVNDTDYAKLITKKAYDYIIMQEAINPYLGKTNADYKKYVDGVNVIVKLTKAKNSNVKFFIRQVWVGKEYGTKDQIFGNGQSTGKFYIREDKTCTTADKKRAYSNTEAIAKSIKATVIYDGFVMGVYNNLYIKSEDALFKNDKYHQTNLGAALSATAIYAAIYKEMPNISTKCFQHDPVVNVAKSTKNNKIIYKQSGNDIVLTKTQIQRIKNVVKAKYSL